MKALSYLVCYSFFISLSFGFEYVLLVDQIDGAAYNLSDDMTVEYVGAPPEWNRLGAINAKYGVRCSIFPSVVDTHARRWAYAIDGIESAKNVILDRVNAEKTETQRTLESGFFELCRTVETTAGVTPTTDKLGFDELEAYIDTIAATDPMTAMKLSLKLMSINSALMRYDLLWWDYAKDFSSSGVPDE